MEATPGGREFRPGDWVRVRGSQPLDSDLVARLAETGVGCRVGRYPPAADGRVPVQGPAIGTLTGAVVWVAADRLEPCEAHAPGLRPTERTGTEPIPLPAGTGLGVLRRAPYKRRSRK